MIDGFYIGSFKIYFYGIIITTGIFVAVWISLKRTRQNSLDGTLIWDMLPWLLISGIIGARLWHVLTPSKSMGVGPNYYFLHPVEIFNLRQGGLGIPGAVIGGVIGLLIFSRSKGQKFWQWTDIIAPGAAIAQSIGRWGNFVNQELYGPPTDLPWGIYIDPAHRLADFEQFSHFHPMFLYESLWNLFNFAILIVLDKKAKKKMIHGDLFLVYCTVYAIGRFFLEFIRIDAAYIGGINANQTFMLVVIVFSLGFLFTRRFITKTKNTK